MIILNKLDHCFMSANDLLDLIDSAGKNANQQMLDEAYRRFEQYKQEPGFWVGLECIHDEIVHRLQEAHDYV